ncbi:MAG: hypothetical protein IPK16_08305 [Anaerolineales bacterium]|nr:hypothetical protein [Anaerolineales bacterium]
MTKGETRKGWVILAGVHEFETAKQLADAATAQGFNVEITSAEQPEMFRKPIARAAGLVLCLHNPVWPQYADLHQAIGGIHAPFAGPVIVARWSSRYHPNVRRYYTEQGVNMQYTEQDPLDVDAVLALMKAALPP